VSSRPSAEPTASVKPSGPVSAGSSGRGESRGARDSAERDVGRVAECGGGDGDIGFLAAEDKGVGHGLIAHGDDDVVISLRSVLLYWRE
jgi:hypothetical protein